MIQVSLTSVAFSLPCLPGNTLTNLSHLHSLPPPPMNTRPLTSTSQVLNQTLKFPSALRGILFFYLPPCYLHLAIVAAQPQHPARSLRSVNSTDSQSTKAHDIAHFFTPKGGEGSRFCNSCK